MSPGYKIALVGAGLLGGGLLANALFRSKTANERARNPLPAGCGPSASVGRAGAGTRDWWTNRNERRKKKHLRMMTAKG